MKERAADGKRVAAECEYLKKYALPYKIIFYMIEVHHVGYQMKALQIFGQGRKRAGPGPGPGEELGMSRIGAWKEQGRSMAGAWQKLELRRSRWIIFLMGDITIDQN